MKTFTRTIALALSLFAFDALGVEIAPIKVTVEAGGVSRRRAPVSAELKVGRHISEADAEQLSNGAKAVLVGAGTTAQAEVVHTPDSRVSAVVVHWIEPELAAGAKKTYQVLLDSQCECENKGFEFMEDVDHRDLVYEAKPVYRHMAKWKWDPKEHAEHFKTYDQIFGFDGETFITKGVGGDFTHHRGLFWGFNTQFGDFWHGRNGVSQRHKEYLDGAELTGPVLARSAAVTDWCDKEGKPVARDTREVSVHRVDDGEYLFDYVITTEALAGTLKLGGDPQHAGFHFRAAQEVAAGNNKKGAATYVRPAGATDKKNDVWADTPWVLMNFSVEGRPYAVMHMDHPSNPRPSVYSTRPYGRTGAYFTADGKTPVEVKQGTPLVARYRIAVMDGKKAAGLGAETLAAKYSDYASPAKATAEPIK